MTDKTDKLNQLSEATKDAAGGESREDSAADTENAVKSELERTATNLEILEDLDDKFGPIYESSVYHDLLFFTHTRSMSALVFGIVVWCTQMYIFSSFFSVAGDLIKSPELNAFITWDYCNEETGEIEDTSRILCPKSDYNYSGWSISMPALLISAFTFADILSTLKVLMLPIKEIGLWAKGVALGVLVATAFAVWAAGLFAYQGFSGGSSFDAVVNCVGVLFVNDIDEKVKDGLKYIDKEKLACCCGKGCCKRHVKVIMYVLWSLICFICMMVSGLTQESYDSYSSSSYYTYYSSSSDSY